MLVDDIAAAVLVAPLRLNRGILAMSRATRLLAVAVALALALLRRRSCRSVSVTLVVDRARLVVDVHALRSIPAVVRRRASLRPWMGGRCGRRCRGRHR